MQPGTVSRLTWVSLQRQLVHAFAEKWGLDSISAGRKYRDGGKGNRANDRGRRLTLTMPKRIPARLRHEAWRQGEVGREEIKQGGRESEDRWGSEAAEFSGIDRDIDDESGAREGDEGAWLWKGCSCQPPESICSSLDGLVRRMRLFRGKGAREGGVEEEARHVLEFERKAVVILRGLPGSGKTFLASELTSIWQRTNGYV